MKDKNIISAVIHVDDKFVPNLHFQILCRWPGGESIGERRDRRQKENAQDAREIWSNARKGAPR